MNQDNFFKHIEVIEASSAKELALKLKSIKVTFQLNQVWSDGTKHYALINPGKKLPVRTIEALAQ